MAMQTQYAGQAATYACRRSSQAVVSGP
jgi:hypothetical protein